MIVRSVDSNGDWCFGRGRNDYKRGGQAVAQSIRTRLQSFLGDCFFDRGAGIDWFNLLGEKDQLALRLSIRTTILNTPGVTGLLELFVNLDDNRRITISYSVSTGYTNIENADGIINGSSAFLLTEGGDLLTTEDGSGIMGG